MNGVSQQQDSLLEDNGETNGLSAMAMESEGFDRTIHMDFSKSGRWWETLSMRKFSFEQWEVAVP